MKYFNAIPMIGMILLSMFQGFPVNSAGNHAALGSGVDITYEVTITAPPEAGIAIQATYSNFTSPLLLNIGYANWQEPTLDVVQDLHFSSPDGQNIPWTRVDFRTIEVSTTSTSIIANYTLNLPMTQRRPTKVSGIGGVLNGPDAFLVPDGQTVNSVKTKFTLPAPWMVVSAYPIDGDWFDIQPYTYADLALEVKASGWYFGNIDFDQTKTYPDGFEIRVVGFKYFPYEHWTVYSESTPLEEALQSADFYYATYLQLKSLYGEFPLPNLLLVGPGYWQAGKSYSRQQIAGWYRYEYIPHHMVHAYFGMQGSRISYSGRFYFILQEGYTTYSEGIMSAEIANDPVWRGMLFERKFHYLRAMKFNNLQQSSSTYVLGFVVTYLMDQEIRTQTDGQSGINDLMVLLWEKYQTPNYAVITDEQVLSALQELTGTDWHTFYAQNVINTNNLDVNALDALKPDFELFLQVISDTWYNGSPSMYFVSQEIVAAVGDLDMNVRMQNPMAEPPNVSGFAETAIRYMQNTATDLTETDIEEILHQFTGKDHSDFFEFYRAQGYEIDPAEITAYVRTFTFVSDMVDNSIILTPNIFPLGQSTSVVGELIDPDFANATELVLQVQVHEMPTGLANIRTLISGARVSFRDFSQDFPTENLGPATNYFFSLPIVTIGDKTYTFFTVNLPEQDAGIIRFSLFGKTIEPTTNDWMGGFIGTSRVESQSSLTFIFKPNSFTVVDETPPLLSIRYPATSALTTEASSYYIQGLVEPGATLTLNGIETILSPGVFEFRGSVDLLPGLNTILVEARDQAGNISAQELTITFSDPLTPTPTPTPTPDDPRSPNAPLFILLGIVLLMIGVGLVVVYILRCKRRHARPRTG